MSMYTALVKFDWDKLDLSKSVCSFVAKHVNSYRLSVGDDELIQF